MLGYRHVTASRNTIEKGIDLMKPRNIASIMVICLALPVQALAMDSSFQHTFTTTYQDGSTQTGSLTVGKAANCVRIALPPEELDEDSTYQRDSRGNEEIIFCQDPEPAMTTLDARNKVYQQFDASTMKAMNDQREQMMKQFGIEPGSDQEEDVFKSIGETMGMMKQKQREGIEEALQDENMTPAERTEAEAYMNENYPNSPSSTSMEISANVIDLHKQGTQKGITCNWYKFEMRGL